MTDPRIAALAEALAHHPVPSGLRYGWSRTAEEDAPAIAAAILAALPPDWCGHDPDDLTEKQQFPGWVRVPGAEIARLRRIEEAAREVADDWFWQGDTNGRLLDLTASMPLLRAALEEGYTIEQRFTATDAFPGAMEDHPQEHGYTCGWCEWGRPDQPRSKADYDRHVQETGHRGEKP